MKRVLVISMGEYPVPAIKGGAVEILTTTFFKCNEQHPTFEFHHIGFYSSGVENAITAFKYTKFYYLKKTFSAKVLNVFFRLWNRLTEQKHNVYTHAILRKINDIKPEVIILESCMELALIIKRLYPNIKLLAHIHNIVQSNPQAKEIVASIDGFMCISQYILYTTQKTIGASSTQMKLLYNCVDTQLFSPCKQETRNAFRMKLGFKTSDMVVIFTGRIQPYKGILQLVEAIKKLDRKDIRLLVVGNSFFEGSNTSPFINNLKEMCSSLKDKIIFTGFIPNPELPQYYCASDLAVLPSTWEEPFGLTCLEAIACGLPVVITQSGGMVEIVDDQCAEIVPNNNLLTVALANKIEQLSNDKVKREMMRQHAPKRASRFGTQQYFDTLKNIINEI